MDFQEFSKKIEPFKYDDEDKYTLWLGVGYYKVEIFDSREEEGFEGNGYDWESLAKVFVDEKMPEIKDKIEYYSSEADTFVVVFSEKSALEEFALAFKAACEDEPLIMDLFSRAELD